MTYPTITLRRSELVARHACSRRLALFDEVCGLGGTGDALSFELSPLAVLWLARDASDVLAWLRDERFCAVNLSGAALTGADLRWTDLRWTDLRWTNLRWAILTGANFSGAALTGAALTGADLRNAILRATDLDRADLRGTDLRGTDLSGAFLHRANLTWAFRNASDPPIAGWTLRNGRLQRALRDVNGP